MCDPNDPRDEVDVDLGEEDKLQDEALERATIPEGVEFLGNFETIEAYLRDQLEPEIQPSVHWIFDCIDWSKVQDWFENDGCRLACEHGHVYKIGGRQ